MNNYMKNTQDKRVKSIMFITAALTSGGAERVISQLSNYFAEIGIKVNILLLSSSEVDYDLHPEIQIISIDKRMGKLTGLLAMFLRLRLIKEYAKLINPDVVISFLSVINIYSCLALALGKYKLIVSERNNPEIDPSNIVKRKIRNIVYLLANGLVFQTEMAKEYFCHKIQKNAIVIPNPIKSALPEPYEGIREKRIVAVGRLENQKNYPLLLRTFACLVEDYSGFTLDIFGVGSDRDELEKLAAELNLTEQVNFKGVVQNVHELIKNASLYVLTSDYEGMPNALMEAMAIGLPCIASNCPCGGSSVLIDHGKNGLLFSVGDQDELLLNMKKVLGDKALAEILSVNAIKIRETYQLPKIAQQWLSFSERVLNGDLQ